MPQHNPEDRVRVKNIVDTKGEDDFQTFWITRYVKVPALNERGEPTNKEVPEQKRIEWNFKKGFFFGWGQKFYSLRPGEEKTYPRFLAEHCAKHMVDYILNKRLLATRTLDENGVPKYKNQIITEHEKQKILDEIIVGVEEWHEGNDKDFDTLLNEQYGGDFESEAREKVDKLDYKIPQDKDFELPEVSQDEPTNIEKPAKITPTDDLELQKMREEADAYAIPYTDKDTTESIKAKVLREMA